MSVRDGSKGTAGSLHKWQQAYQQISRIAWPQDTQPMFAQLQAILPQYTSAGYNGIGCPLSIAYVEHSTSCSIRPACTPPTRLPYP